MITLNTTASTLKAILCFTNSGVTPDIAYDNDDFIQPLNQKIKETLGNFGGTNPVSISFNDGEEELFRQFQGCCCLIAGIYAELSEGFQG